MTRIRKERVQRTTELAHALKDLKRAGSARDDTINVLRSIIDCLTPAMVDRRRPIDGIEVSIAPWQLEILERLAGALGELKHGSVDEILKPTPAQNRPMQPRNQRAVKEMARFGYRALRVQGCGADEAARKVADALHSEGHRYTGKHGQKRISLAQVREWAKPPRGGKNPTS